MTARPRKDCANPSRTSYRNGCRCPGCTAANAKYNREYTARRRATNPMPGQTPEVHNAAMREWRRKRRDLDLIHKVHADLSPDDAGSVRWLMETLDLTQAQLVRRALRLYRLAAEAQHNGDDVKIGGRRVHVV